MSTNRIKALQNQLQKQSTSTENSQASGSKRDIDQLKKTVNVRDRAKQISESFSAKTIVLKAELKANEVSTQAKKELTEDQFKTFENNQDTQVQTVIDRVNKDIEELANASVIQEIGNDKFFELALIYRTYEVCLEQEFYRYAAIRTKTREERLIKYGIEGSVYKNKENIEYVKNSIEQFCDDSAKLAAQSLNYYEDFFKRLKEIEKIWPTAGTDIRWSEMRLLFMAINYCEYEVIFKLLNYRDKKMFEEGSKEFKAKLNEHINTLEIEINKVKVKFLVKFIESGDGLDMENHPWKKIEGFGRMQQPNQPINLNNVTTANVMYTDSKNRVEERSQSDVARLKK